MSEEVNNKQSPTVDDIRLLELQIKEIELEIRRCELNQSTRDSYT
jgi:hypothetical protein